MFTSILSWATGGIELIFWLVGNYDPDFRPTYSKMAFIWGIVGGIFMALALVDYVIAIVIGEYNGGRLIWQFTCKIVIMRKEKILKLYLLQKEIVMQLESTLWVCYCLY